jgi:signal transduction histidine kinase
VTAPVTRSLTWRLGVAMALTAVLGALLAGLLAAPLLASTTRDAVRDPLARQADLLSRLSTRTLDSQRADTLASRNGLLLGAVDPDGTPHGVAAALTASQLSALAAGDPVSTRATYLGKDVLVEARPTRDGGAVAVADQAGLVGAVRAKLVRRVVLALLIGLALAVVAALAAAGRVGRPLRELAAGARRLASGERGVPLPTSTTTEVADVSAALAGLDHALTASEARQRSFLLSVSHELRTPLTTMRGYAEGLADGVVGPDEAADVGRTLVAEADRMERYVADLLALARLEADDFSLDLARTDVAALLRTTADTWRGRAGPHEIPI